MDANLWLGEGSKLVMKFKTYGGSNQGENIVWSDTTPDNVSFSKTMPHPQDEPVEKVELVLTDGAGAEIDMIATFTVTRDTLALSLVSIYLDWAFASLERKDNVLIPEIVDLYLQWAVAPF